MTQTPIVPSSGEPIGYAGNIPVMVSPTYQRFFGNLVGNPPPIVPVSLTASPFSFTASATGNVSIVGGTVSGMTLKRAKVTIPVTGSIIPMMNADVLTVSYSAAPTVSFIPS